jgi:hypothetical protein
LFFLAPFQKKKIAGTRLLHCIARKRFHWISASVAPGRAEQREEKLACHQQSDINVAEFGARSPLPAL